MFLPPAIWTCPVPTAPPPPSFPWMAPKACTTNMTVSMCDDRRPKRGLVMRKNLGSRFLLWEPLLTPAPHLLCFLSERTKEDNSQLSCGPNSGSWPLSRDGPPLSKEAGAQLRGRKPNAEKQSSTVKTAESLSHGAAHRRLRGNQNKNLGWAKLLLWQ